jgi:hypothetical protein
MTQKKKTYMAPTMEVTNVEIEASICSGSVEFGRPEDSNEKQVVIQDQTISTDFGDKNDFSANQWGDQSGTN